MSTVDREQVLYTFRKAQVPQRYLDFFERCAPEGLTAPTLDALGRYVKHTSRRSAKDETVSDPAESDPGRELLSGWEADGGTTADLMKFIAVVEYTVRAVYRGPGPGIAELTAFWSTGGHDLSELGDFLPQTDKEVITDLSG
ncbi:hypothetical protein [Saccharothrix sp. Mg75]|uniref:hypothetical protein n=1 Tax=Saccharothrix sp. Mg75 TaxID=3445357 RepID=UPI003EE95257